MKINFVTSNRNKVREFKASLGNSVTINHVEMAYPEMRSDNPEEIAKSSAKMLAEQLKKNVVVEDSGLFIHALKGFPGTCSAYIHKRIGLEGILKLMESVKDRRCIYKSAVAYCEPGKEPISFLGYEEGEIAENIKGEYGFGHDPIFVPEGFSQTYGEMSNAEDIKKFRKMAVEQLKEYLLKQCSKKQKI